MQHYKKFKLPIIVDKRAATTIYGKLKQKQGEQFILKYFEKRTI